MYAIPHFLSSRFMHRSPSSKHQLPLRVGDYRIVYALATYAISILTITHRKHAY
jgi:mRNA-degrading endonuclease RelE of RelBE toxin-antitoxin system